MWDPKQYNRFSDQRSRPFYELMNRVGAVEPASVADIGCGPGELTAELARRWPAAEVVGVDDSPEMIAAARRLPDVSQGDPGGRAPGSAPTAKLRFEEQDAGAWHPTAPVDVIVSNALLQWLPGHEELLIKWLGYLAEGGWLAFQVPANHDQVAHTLLHEQAGSAKWRARLGDVLFSRQTGDPASYLELLASEGCVVDAWETTYMQLLSGENPVLEWFKGTALRPVLAALDEEARADFLAEYGPKLLSAYPPASYGTLFRFRRVFVVAHK
jgi:trans-aconitate 2-methyltransferase